MVCILRSLWFECGCVCNRILRKWLIQRLRLFLWIPLSIYYYSWNKIKLSKSSLVWLKLCAKQCSLFYSSLNILWGTIKAVNALETASDLFSNKNKMQFTKLIFHISQMHPSSPFTLLNQNCLWIQKCKQTHSFWLHSVLFHLHVLLHQVTPHLSSP